MKSPVNNKIQGVLESLPLRERGLKFVYCRPDCPFVYVAPLAGAWIEIAFSGQPQPHCAVAPLAGAWIEIVIEGIDEKNEDVAPLAGAWIEIRRDRMTVAIAPTSLPLRERGLKSPDLIIIYIVSRRSPCGSVD